MGKPTISETGKRQLQLLLVGGSEREFADLCQLLREANHGHICFEHATSLEDSLNKLRRQSYDLLLCSDHSTDNVAFQLLRQMRQHYSGVPIIFLSDPVNREAIETAVQAAGCHGAAQNNRLEPSPEFAAAIDTLSAERQQVEREHQEPDEALRKLWHSVEQMADALIIMDRSGVMEYVNPAFEALTGYSRDEAIGQPLRNAQIGATRGRVLRGDVEHSSRRQRVSWNRDG